MSEDNRLIGETHLEAAHRLYYGPQSIDVPAVLGHLLAHLEQQAHRDQVDTIINQREAEGVYSNPGDVITLKELKRQSAPPEERHKSLTLADLFEVCEKLAEDVRLLKFPPEAAPDVNFCVCATYKGFVEGQPFCAHCGKPVTPPERINATPADVCVVCRATRAAHDSLEWSFDHVFTSAPEAAPERATREEVWSVAPADSLTTEEWRHWYIRAQETSESAQRQVAELEGQLKALQPSAVQGEERTDELRPFGLEVDPRQEEREEFTFLDLWWKSLPYEDAIALKAYWHDCQLLASSSPTATAHRGEEHACTIANCIKTTPHSGTCISDGVAIPLPAQAEPGACEALARRIEAARGLDALDLAEELLAPQPPSPAPECAHDGIVPLYAAWPSVEPQAWKCLSCSRLSLTDVIDDGQTAPSLPTEGEG